jgi:hypothetical protein
MRVYQIRYERGCRTISPDDAEQYLSLVTSRGFDGRSLANGWSPLPCHVMDAAAKHGDFAAFALTAFAFTRSVGDVFGELFRSVGEVLPLAVPDEPYEVLNVTRTIAAVQASEPGDQFQRGHLNSTFSKLVFDPERLIGETLFRASENKYLLFAVGDQGSGVDFPAEVERLGFKGLRFDLVWSIHHDA